MFIINVKQLIAEIESLKKSRVRDIIYRRITSFEETGKSGAVGVFKELCFCLLTAGFRADRCIKIQRSIDNGFLKLPEKQLAEELKKSGYRFHNIRAKYIVDARKYADNIDKILCKIPDEKEKRRWLVKNIRGLGYKEASHFLRNIGYKNLAIIDFHILDILSRYKIIEKPPKTLTEKRYLAIEKQLELFSRKISLTLAELDLYLWYIETSTVLK